MGSLRRHDSRDSCGRERLALLEFAADNSVEGRRCHPHLSARDCLAPCDRFRAHIDHADSSASVEMRQSGGRGAPRRWLFLARHCSSDYELTLTASTYTIKCLISTDLNSAQQPNKLARRFYG